MRDAAIAVIDIGKSNAKLALVDRVSRATLAVSTVGNAVVSAPPYPHYDVDRVWTWIIDGLREFAVRADIEAIAVTTHGAALALMAGERLALPVLDYEHDLSVVDPAYDALRGDFSETLSPNLPGGLNAGRQLYWQRAMFPAEFAKADAILSYPQYWVWRLTGQKVAEATSLGSHTDLWNPRAATWSRLATGQGWDRLFPALVRPWDTVGTLRPEIAAATDIAASCRVVAGIHDSNASLLPHLIARPKPFAVLSSGTWMIVFAPGGALDALDRDRDCLANVDAFGEAVPSARFMAGREYAIIAGEARDPDDGAVARVVAGKVMALPAFAAGTGPFGRCKGRWSSPPERLSPAERAAAGSLYAALMAETCLGLAGASGPVIVEGPFANNAVFLSALASLVPSPVLARPDATGTTDGAALLAYGPKAAAPVAYGEPVPPLGVDLHEYAAAWRAASDAALAQVQR
jgi:sugar (pentulose or hexulose) kinase